MISTTTIIIIPQQAPRLSSKHQKPKKYCRRICCRNPAVTLALNIPMAKGLRSSVTKANRSRLRSRVFRPVEEARKQRLSAKLLAKTAEPPPNAKGDTTLPDGSAILPVDSPTLTANDNSSLHAEPSNGGDVGTQSISRGGTADPNPCMPRILKVNLPVQRLR